jgi:2-aminoethylphosphonate-pyruvate transaminase
MVQMVKTLCINYSEYALGETEIPNAGTVLDMLEKDSAITHVAMVHCETTTGILNPLKEIADVVKQHQKIFIVDAMSSFGGIPLDAEKLGIDFLISSSNKCIQGVPGFAFVIAKKSVLENCEGNARSVCLDLYSQWKEMDKTGKWRYTSPTHIVRAFYQALDELEAEGGVQNRNRRYTENQKLLSLGMSKAGFKPLLPENLQSPIITSFLYPYADFNFFEFYAALKRLGFVIYPGKISMAPSFRIGTIGEVYPSDIERFLAAAGSVL